MRKILLSVLLLVTMAGCSSKKASEVPKDIQKLENLKVYSTEAKPEYQLTLKPDVNYADTSEVFFGPLIMSVEVDASGRVFVLDFRQHKTHVFNADGSYIESVGRNGRGPGEFLQAWKMRVTEEHLYILDPSQTKISVFDQETFEHVKDFNISLDAESGNAPSWIKRTKRNGTFYRPNNFYLLSDGNYLIIFSDNGVVTADNLPGRRYEMSIYDPEKEKYIKHNILSLEWTGQVLVHGGGVMFKVPYKRQTQFSYANGQFVSAWTEDFAFKFYDEQGSYQRAFYYPFEKKSFKQKDAFAFYNADKSIKEAIRNDSLPETWPAFHSMLLDDQNRLWVSTFTDNIRELKWRVFASSGKLLGSFRWPVDRELQEVKGGYAYILQRNREDRRVRRFQVQLAK